MAGGALPAAAARQEEANEEVVLRMRIVVLILSMATSEDEGKTHKHLPNCMECSAVRPRETSEPISSELAEPLVRVREAVGERRVHYALFGTLFKARNEVGHEIWHGMAWHDVAWRGRAGQAFRLGEPALWTGPPPIRSPRATLGRDRMTRSPRRSSSQGTACGSWTRSLEPTRARSQTNRPLEKKARHVGRARSRVGWTSLPLTPNATHFAENTRSGRLRAAFGHALGGSGPGSGSASLSLIR